MENQLRVVANLARAFHMEGRLESGRLPPSRICYIVVRHTKHKLHKLKVAWPIIVYRMQTSLTGSNEPGPGSMILDPRIWTLDVDLVFLDDVTYHRIWHIIVCYCILEWRSSFQPKYDCSQHFQFSVRTFQTIVVLVFIDWYHSCTYIDYISIFNSYLEVEIGGFI